MHITTYVLLPEDETNIARKLDELILPYAQSFAVSPYERGCECVYFNAFKKAADLAAALGAGMRGLCLTFKKEAVTKEDLIERHTALLRLGSPDSSCEECNGSGVVISTENPNVQYDSWDVDMSAYEKIIEDCLVDSAILKAKEQIVPVRNLVLRKVPTPDAILTPDGTWHESEEWIWNFHAVVKDENWPKKVLHLLEGHTNTLLVPLDCHR
jgi:hypothetical protein